MIYLKCKESLKTKEDLENKQSFFDFGRKPVPPKAEGQGTTGSSKQIENDEPTLIFYDMQSNQPVPQKEMSLTGFLSSNPALSNEEMAKSYYPKMTASTTEVEIEQHFNFAISQDGRYLAIGALNMIKVYDITTKEELSPFYTDLLDNGLDFL